MTDLSTNKSLIQKILKIGLPIAIQNFVGTLLNLIDNMMIGSRGEAALAAVSISNRIFFIMIITLFGVYSGIGIYTAQYWGKKDLKNIKKLMGMAFTIGLTLSTTFTLVTLLLPAELISIFSRDPEVIQKGTSYLSIAALTYIPVSLSFVFSYTSRSVHRTKIPMIASIVALSINTFLNYLFINGNWGMPELGVRGAAIATLTARLVELTLLMLIIYNSKDHPLAGKLKEFFGFSFAMFKRVLKTAFPVIINESAWVVGVSVYFIAYGFLGTAAIASAQVALTISDLIWAFLIGMGNATAVLVGNQLGANKIESAFSIAKRLVKMEFVVTLFLAVIYAAFGYLIAGLFGLTDETKDMATKCIYVTAAFIPIRQLGFVYIVGILRSGGDTRFCMFLDIGMVWFLGIPLAFLAVLVFKLPIYWAMAIINIEEVLKVVFARHRFLSKKWINVLVEHEDDH
ncbi:MAG: MATE family efflux transporter [Clostridia bacterium]|nr:MATE family efflux transporter [Clostridia bacterium]